MPMNSTVPVVPCSPPREDGPWRDCACVPSVSCSPRPRGWSQFGHLIGDRGALFPAPTGMVPPG